ncbi:MAG: hypothetical protein VX798_09890 [Bacteroidota bacterium]|uniref:Uncharacterized protein n=1 Tax=Flagellimonas profundi TaxID=2915620 RepID=A0ABS3FEX8_9FLAO|nr:hypothetical protein [Allomuricauda profundi]MBO0341713.1 hypothetical protein [Allomuricauda profundi]MEC7771485.1 hypothetical protein [Bacteroidota bacterium]
MKSRKIILLIVFVIGLLSLWLMSSFNSPANACQYASTNLEYIKNQIQEAVLAKDLNMAKYHAYKALNGIEKTKSNFLDCGCEGAIESLGTTLSHLKSATKSNVLQKSKLKLHKALESTIIGLNVLEEFGQQTSSDYGSNVLVMNTKEVLDFQNGTLLTQGAAVKKQVHQCLLGFESSLNKVVTDVDCKDANRFIRNIYEESRLTLLNTELSQHKKEYHQRVKTLAEEALEKLGNCN